MTELSFYEGYLEGKRRQDVVARKASVKERVGYRAAPDHEILTKHLGWKYDSASGVYSHHTHPGTLGYMAYKNKYYTHNNGKDLAFHDDYLKAHLHAARKR
jgi:hypothetical protein